MKPKNEDDRLAMIHGYKYVYAVDLPAFPNKSVVVGTKIDCIRHKHCSLHGNLMGIALD